MGFADALQTIDNNDGGWHLMAALCDTARDGRRDTVGCAGDKRIKTHRFGILYRCTITRAYCRFYGLFWWPGLPRIASKLTHIRRNICPTSQRHGTPFRVQGFPDTLYCPAMRRIDAVKHETRLRRNEHPAINFRYETQARNPFVKLLRLNCLGQLALNEAPNFWRTLGTALGLATRSLRFLICCVLFRHPRSPFYYRTASRPHSSSLPQNSHINSRYLIRKRIKVMSCR